MRSGERGVKPLTDKDRVEIRGNIDGKVLKGQPIAFRSTSARDAGGSLTVEGELTMGGSTRPVTMALETGDGGRLTGAISLTQSEWGIKPYRGLMGALKVRDDVEVVVEGTTAHRVSASRLGVWATLRAERPLSSVGRALPW